MIRRDFKFFILICLCLLGFSCSLQNKYGTVTFALPENGNSSGKSAARGVGELPLGDALPETYTIKLTPNVGKIIVIEGKAGQNVVIANLVPGNYEVIVEGEKSGFLYHGKTNVVVESGKTAEARLALYKSEIIPEGGVPGVTIYEAMSLIDDSNGNPVKLNISDTYNVDELTQLAEKINSRSGSQTVELDLSDYKNMTEVPAELFHNNCVSLKSVVLPSSVQTIGASAFQSCSNLTNINLANVTSLDSNAFNGCEKLTSVDLSNVTEIPSACFFNCYDLSNVTVSNNLTKILSQAFYECEALKFFTIPSSVTVIGSNAFGVINKNPAIGLLSVNFEDKDSTWNIAKTGEQAIIYTIKGPTVTAEDHANALKVYYANGYTWTKR